MKISSVSVQYHEELNPKLWNGMKLKQKVRQKLLEIVQEFIKFCEIPNIEPKLVYMTGSLCGYNYTSKSDIDVHIRLDFKEFDCPEIVEQMFDAKRDVFTEKFNISIYGFPVEVYAQDISDENIAAGEYDLIKAKWLEKPQYSPPDINGREIKQKISSLRRKINKIFTKEADYKEAKALMKRIKAWRKASLEEGGEFSSENLVFKSLRNDGTIGKLINYINTAKSGELSLEGVEEFNNEDNEEPTLAFLFKKQQARTFEWHKIRYKLWMKYKPHFINKLMSFNILQNIDDELVAPINIYPKQISSDERIKATLAFQKMINAKQAFREAGGHFTNILKEGVEEFENQPMTFKGLYQKQLAQTLQFCRLRDKILKKYFDDDPYFIADFKSFDEMALEPARNTFVPNQLKFPSISKSDEAKIEVAFQKMVTAKNEFFNHLRNS